MSCFLYLDKENYQYGWCSCNGMMLPIHFRQLTAKIVDNNEDIFICKDCVRLCINKGYKNISNTSVSKFSKNKNNTPRIKYESKNLYTHKKNLHRISRNSKYDDLRINQILTLVNNYDGFMSIGKMFKLLGEYFNSYHTLKCVLFRLHKQDKIKMKLLYNKNFIFYSNNYELDIEFGDSIDESVYLWCCEYLKDVACEMSEITTKCPVTDNSQRVMQAIKYLKLRNDFYHTLIKSKAYISFDLNKLEELIGKRTKYSLMNILVTSKGKEILLDDLCKTLKRSKNTVYSWLNSLHDDETIRLKFVNKTIPGKRGHHKFIVIN